MSLTAEVLLGGPDSQTLLFRLFGRLPVGSAPLGLCGGVNFSTTGLLTHQGPRDLAVTGV